MNDAAAAKSNAIGDAILAGLNDAQRAATVHLDGPSLVVAGAGSGKTRVLTHRVAALLATGVSPAAILAITFTNKAANEMRERVRALVGPTVDDMWISTFHAACVRILRADGPWRWFSIIDAADTKAIISDILAEAGIRNQGGKTASTVAKLISNAKGALRDVDSLAVDNPNLSRVLSLVWGRYQAQLTAMRAYDFDDLIVETVRMLERDPQVAARWRERFRYVLIDEYQDTNYAQYRLVSTLVAGHNNLCAIGDPDQSIYGFRGADISHILRFETDWPGAAVFILDRNYRSTGNILRAAAAVIADNPVPHRAELWTERGDGAPVLTHVVADDHAEAAFVVERIGAVGSWGDHAILYRTNAQSRIIEESLGRYGIRYQLVGGTRFYERAEVKDALAWLKLAANANDLVSFRRIVNKPRRGLGPKRIGAVLDAAAGGDIVAAAHIAAETGTGAVAAGWGRFRDQYQAVVDAIEEGGVAAGIEVVLLGVDANGRLEDVIGTANPTQNAIERSGSEGLISYYYTSDKEKAADRVANLLELAAGISQFSVGREAGGMASLQAYLDHVALITDLDTMDEGDRVTLMTLHAAKGLEFPHVTIIGVEDEILPLHGAARLRKAEFAEERRLAYVGITRAMDTLVLTRARKRLRYGTIEQHAPSVFFTEVAASQADQIRAGAIAAGFSPKRVRTKRTGGGEETGTRQADTGSETDEPTETTGDTVERVDANLLRVGVRVRHLHLGDGVIVDVSRVSNDVICDVRFTDGTQRRFLAGMAPLEIL